MRSTLPNTKGAAAYVRWLLLGSLALNLLFVGAAGAVALRYSSAVPLTDVARLNHGPDDRLERLVASLPPADAAVVRAEFRSDAQEVAAARADVRLSQEDLRNSLRADPFDSEAMRTAMAQSRAAHDKLELVLQHVIATAAGKMSVVGRNKLADWQPAPNNKTSRN
jgi:uncharacterized membrane protein